MLEHATRQLHQFAGMILAENIATVAGVPHWLSVSDRVSKHRSIALAAPRLAAWSLPLLFFGPGDGAWLAACSRSTGTGCPRPRARRS